MPTKVVNVRTYQRPFIYVGRVMPGRKGHPLANPFRLVSWASPEERKDCLARYEEWLLGNPYHEKLLRELAEEVSEYGSPLGCWCAPNPLCHASVLAREVDRLLAEEARSER